MLTIDINNSYFALDTAFSVRISALNPACFMDKIPGDAGLGISIPVNDINRGILGSPERFSKYFPAGDPGVRFPGCSIRFGGALLLSGSLVVTQATAETYDCWLQSNLGVMGEAMQEKNITTLPWPTGQTFQNKATYNDETDDYGVATILNRNFWEGKGKEVPNSIVTDDGQRDETISLLKKQHFDNFSWMVNAPDFSTGGIKTTGDGCVVSPYLHLRYVIKKALAMLGFWQGTNEMLLAGISFVLPLEKNLMIYNNFNIMKGIYTKIPVSHYYWDEDARTMVEESVEEITSVAWGLGTFNYADLLPKISVKDFLIGIQNSLNYILRFHSSGRFDILDREAIPVGNAIDVSAYIIGFWEMGERKSRRLKFIPELDNDDENFGSNYEDLTDRLSDFKSPVATRAELDALVSPETGELRVVNQENKIYEYRWRAVSNEGVNHIEHQLDAEGWDFISNNTQPYIYEPQNEENEEIKIPVSTVPRKTISIFFTIFQTIQRGNLSQMRSTWNDFTFRVIPQNAFFWPNGMEWDGETGLFNTRWKNWARLWANRQQVQAEFQLPLNVLIHVTENITSKFRTDDGEFIIEEISTEFGLNMIGKTSIKGYKI